MFENEKPVKKKRGRPPGSPNKNGTPYGRKPGSGRKKMSTVLNESGGVDPIPPSQEIVASRPPKPLDLTREITPVTALPVPDEATAVPTMIRTVLAIRSTVDLDDPITLWNALEQYLNLCATTGMKITNGTLYMACGIGRAEIHNWEFGLRRQNNPEYRKFAVMCKSVCAAAREQYGIEGQTNAILTIFHQKFYDGFTDTPQKEAVKDPLGEISDPEKIAEKYADIIVD